MTATQRTIYRARRRLTVRWALSVLGDSMLGGMVVAVALLLIVQGFNLTVPRWLYAVPVGFGVFITLGLTLTRRWDTQRVATLIDERLHLKDTLGTAVYAQTLDPDELTRQVADDAEQRAAGVKLNEAFPLTPRRWRAWGAAVAIGLVFAGLSVDPFDLRSRSEANAAETQANAEQAATIREALVEAAEQARPLGEDDPRRQASDGKAGEVLDPADLDERLDAMLARRDLTNPEDRRAAEAELSDLQERFAQQVERKQEKQDRMQNALSHLDAGEQGPADEFTEALRRGDFQQAREELAGLSKDLENGDLGEAEKQRLGEQLDTLSEQLEEQAAAQEQLAEQKREALQEQLEDQGVPKEQAERLTKDAAEPNEVSEAVEQAQREQGKDDSQAKREGERAAEQVKDAQQQAQDAKETSEQAKGLASKLGRLADSMKENQSPEQQSQDAQQAQKQLGEMAKESGRTEQMRDADGKLKEAQQQMAESKRPPAPPPAPDDGESGKPPQEASQEQGAESQQAQRPSESPGDQEKPGDGKQPGDQPNQGPPQAEGGQPAGPSRDPNGQQAGAARSESPEGGGTGPGQGVGDGGNPLGQPTDRGNPASHVAHDIQDGDGGRITTSWTNDGEPTTGPTTTTTNPAVTEGRAEAERAVNEDRTPKRYHRAIREYFDNLPAE